MSLENPDKAAPKSRLNGVFVDLQDMELYQTPSMPGNTTLPDLKLVNIAPEAGQPERDDGSDLLDDKMKKFPAKVRPHFENLSVPEQIREGLFPHEATKLASQLLKDLTYQILLLNLYDPERTLSEPKYRGLKFDERDIGPLIGPKFKE